MNTTITGVSTTRELAEKLNDVCRIKKVKDKQLILTYNNRNFVIKPDETADNEFIVNLVISEGVYIFGCVLGFIVSCATGLTGFIFMTIFIVVISLITASIYKAANKTELEKFVALLEGGREKIKQRIIAIIREKLKDRNISGKVIDENTSLAGLGTDMIDWVEITYEIEKEYGINFPQKETEVVGPATAAFMELNHIKENEYDKCTADTVKLHTDVVMELLQRKDDGSQSTDSETKEESTSNKTGELQWSFDNGTLTIRGKGDMQSFDDYTAYPWCNLKSETSTLIIENGVTSIGERAFQFFVELKQISIADTVRTIGRLAFGYCQALEAITVPDSVTSLGKRAFAHCSSLKAFIIPQSVTFIGPDLLDMMMPINLEYILVQWDEPMDLDHFESNESIGPVLSTILLTPRGSETKYQDAGWNGMPIYEYDKAHLFNLKQSGMNDYFICRVLHGMEIKRRRGDYN
jgi:acyl carrier protein